MVNQPLNLDAIRARHDDPESCADTVAMLAALDARDAEIRRLTTDLQQAQQQLVGIATVRVWKNEDGLEFLYAADVRAAINCPDPAAVSGA